MSPKSSHQLTGDLIIFKQGLGYLDGHTWVNLLATIGYILLYAILYTKKLLYVLFCQT